MSHNDLSNQEKLDQMYHLIEENNEILRSMRRRENLATVFKFIYWVIILGSLGGVYIFLSPLINIIKQSGDTLQDPRTRVEIMEKLFPQASQLQSVINSAKEMQQTILQKPQ